MKSWLEKIVLKMYSTHNKGKCVVPERFIKNLKNKIINTGPQFQKRFYIDKWDDIVNK